LAKIINQIWRCRGGTQSDGVAAAEGGAALTTLSNPSGGPWIDEKYSLQHAAGRGQHAAC